MVTHTPFVRKLGLALTAVLLVGAAGCSGATSPSEPATPSASPSAQATPSAASAPFVLDKEDPEAWTHACAVNTEHMNALMEPLGHQITHTKAGKWWNQCYYNYPPDSNFVVSIQVLQYVTDATYGYGGGPSWRATSPAEGYSNACASFAEAPSGMVEAAYVKNPPICDPTIGQGAVISKARRSAVVFLDGPYFYSVEVGGAEGDEVVDPITGIMKAIAAAESPTP